MIFVHIIGIVKDYSLSLLKKTVFGKKCLKQEKSFYLVNYLEKDNWSAIRRGV